MMISFQRCRVRVVTLLFCLITLITFLFTYTLPNPSVYFFKHAFHLPDSFFSKRICACDQCMRELDDDPWLMERFNHSIKPLLNRKTSVLTEDTYRWWQWLQAESQPANYSDVVDKLFQLIPDNECYEDGGPNRCRTCAVVGNSGNLLGSHYGPLIDSNELVIRMNHAPTVGFESDVGTRTTHHIMYPESAINLGNDTSLVLIPFKTLDLQWLISVFTTGTITSTYIPVKSRIKANKEKVLIYSPTFFKYVYETWLDNHGRYPSTGFLTLILAIHICDEVNLFGFGADQNGNWNHYWEENQYGGAYHQTGVHDGDYERNVTLLLAKKHKIKIF